MHGHSAVIDRPSISRYSYLRLENTLLNNCSSRNPRCYLTRYLIDSLLFPRGNNETEKDLDARRCGEQEMISARAQSNREKKSE